MAPSPTLFAGIVCEVIVRSPIPSVTVSRQEVGVPRERQQLSKLTGDRGRVGQGGVGNLLS